MVTRNRITRKALEDAYQEIHKLGLNAASESFALASAVTRGFLGQNWFDRQVMPGPRRRGFLTIDESTPLNLDHSAYRIMDLAELLFNLQDVAGFDECITRMRNGDIEGTHAELDFGRMLYLHRVPFRYVVPQGVTGLDYDVDVLYPSGLAVCGDAKCKVESTAFSIRTIDQALEKARSQLPDDKPGIVFLKVPPLWMEIPNFATMAVNTAHDFFRTTRRIVSVKYYVSPVTFADGVLKAQHAFKEISNRYTDFGDWVDWDIFHKIEMLPEWNGMPPWWQRIIFYPDGKVR